MRLATVIACTLWVTMVGIMPGFAEKRVALVIGNSNYQHVGRLPNSVNDAAAIATLLRSAGFQVVEPRSDIGMVQMRRAISDFAETTRDNDIAVIYLAGHSVEVDVTIYLIPVDAVLARDFDVGDETISLDRVPPAAAGPCGGVSTVPLSSRGAAPLSAAEECALKPKDSFRECANCPELVVVPAASFTMGSPESEKDRRNDEGPQHRVTIGKPFAVGKFHVTVDQFAAFVAETGYDAGSKCRTFEDGKVEERSGRSWRNPGFAQSGSHPAVCLSLNDAKAYMDWLARKTGKPYRLLTEAEWEYAARARIEPAAYSRYSFGDDENDLCRYGNGADQTAKSTVPGASNWTIAPCDDGYAYTSPVGSFAANAFGLYDMQGNARQWTEDCYHDNYAGAPSDGSAWTTGDCSRRVLRGGSWSVEPGELRAAFRVSGTASFRSRNDGFRVGRTLTP
jgi:formylglycine-generating enzyme required for sulfatase activity